MNITVLNISNHNGEKYSSTKQQILCHTHKAHLLNSNFPPAYIKSSFSTLLDGSQPLVVDVRFQQLLQLSQTIRDPGHKVVHPAQICRGCTREPMTRCAGPPSSQKVRGPCAYLRSCQHPAGSGTPCGRSPGASRLEPAHTCVPARPACSHGGRPELFAVLPEAVPLPEKEPQINTVPRPSSHARASLLITPHSNSDACEGA